MAARSQAVGTDTMAMLEACPVTKDMVDIFGLGWDQKFGKG